MIRPCIATDFDTIYAIVNDAAMAYKGVIPADRWHAALQTRSVRAALLAVGLDSDPWGGDFLNHYFGGQGEERVLTRDQIAMIHASPKIVTVVNHPKTYEALLHHRSARIDEDAGPYLALHYVPLLSMIIF